MELQGMLTRRGRQLRAAALAGTAPLVFTRFSAGSGSTGDAAAALAEERQTLTAGVSYTEGDTVVMPVMLVAAQAEAAYTLAEVGAYVRDGTGESLYCVYRASQPLEIDPASALTIRFELEELFSEGLNVTVNPADTLRREAMGVEIATLDEGGAVPVGQMPYTYGTEDLTAGETPLEEGHLHFVYE